MSDNKKYYYIMPVNKLVEALEERDKQIEELEKKVELLELTIDLLRQK